MTADLAQTCPGITPVDVAAVGAIVELPASTLATVAGTAVLVDRLPVVVVVDCVVSAVDTEVEGRAVTRTVVDDGGGPVDDVEVRPVDPDVVVELTVRATSSPISAFPPPVAATELCDVVLPLSVVAVVVVFVVVVVVVPVVALTIVADVELSVAAAVVSPSRLPPT